MGISGLLPLLKSIHKPIHLKAFHGRILAVDAYGWLHKGTIACAADLALGKPTRKYIDYVLDKVRMLRHYGVEPYLVFDGDYLPSKAITESDRKRKRETALNNGLSLQKAGKVNEAYSEFQKAIDVTPRMACLLIEELKMLGVSYVVAPYEADAQMAYLERHGHVSGVISEDSDLLVFGVHCLITKLDQFGNCVEVNRTDFGAATEVNLAGWTDEEFRHMCILSGCDYLASIPRMGLKTAHRLVRRHKRIDKIIKALQFDGSFVIPQNYINDFQRANLTFLHQRVFSIDRKRLVHCQDIDSAQPIEGPADYLGSHYPDDIAWGVATGHLDPITKQPVSLKIAKSTQSQVTQFFALQSARVKSNPRLPLQRISPNERVEKQPLIRRTSYLHPKTSLSNTLSKPSTSIKSNDSQTTSNTSSLKRSYTVMTSPPFDKDTLTGRLCMANDAKILQSSPFFTNQLQAGGSETPAKRLKRVKPVTLNPPPRSSSDIAGSAIPQPKNGHLFVGMAEPSSITYPSAFSNGTVIATKACINTSVTVLAPSLLSPRHDKLRKSLERPEKLASDIERQGPISSPLAREKVTERSTLWSTIKHLGYIDKRR